MTWKIADSKDVHFATLARVLKTGKERGQEGVHVAPSPIPEKKLIDSYDLQKWA